MTKTLVCTRCGYKTSVKVSMQRHLTRKNPCKPKIEDIDINDVYENIFGEKIKNLYLKKIKNTVDKTVRKHDGLLCAFCGKKFTRKAYTKEHMKNKCKLNPLNHPLEDIDITKDDDSHFNISITNNNNIQNIQNIQNNISIGKILNLYLNDKKIKTISRDNITNFGEEGDDGFKSISNNLYLKSIGDGKSIPNIPLIASSFHFDKNDRFHNIRIVQTFDNANVYKISNLEEIMHNDETPVDLIELSNSDTIIDKEYIDEFGQMFTQVLTKDGWKNVDIYNVVHTLISYISRRIESFLDEKYKSIMKKETKQEYEDRNNQQTHIISRIRALIKCYNKYGEITPEKVFDNKNRMIRYAVTQKLTLEKAKEIRYANEQNLIDQFNYIVKEMIEILKTKSKILHGDNGEKLIILNDPSVLSLEECSFEALVDGDRYQELFKNGHISFNEIKNIPENTIIVDDMIDQDYDLKDDMIDQDSDLKDDTIYEDEINVYENDKNDDNET